MKDGKTTKSNAKKKNTVKETNKSKVKDVDFTPIEENFLDENEDKRLIVFIALAILIIVGTIIGLLVGCQKKEQDEPKKPTDDIVEPTDKDKKDNDKKKEERYDYEKPLPIVRKVTTASKKTKTKNSSNTNTDSESKETHIISFIMGDNSELVDVKDGEKLEEFVPKGYKECKYYSDEEMQEEFDFTSNVTEDKNIYMVCTLIEYEIEYSLDGELVQTSNPTSYTVESNEATLEDLNVSEGTFLGWFSDSEKTNQINKLDKSIIDLADGNNVIHIYASVTTGNDDVISNEELKEETSEEPNDEEVTNEANETKENEEENLDNLEGAKRSLSLNNDLGKSLEEEKEDDVPEEENKLEENLEEEKQAEELKDNLEEEKSEIVEEKELEEGTIENANKDNSETNEQEKSEIVEEKELEENLKEEKQDEELEKETIEKTNKDNLETKEENTEIIIEEEKKEEKKEEPKEEVKIVEPEKKVDEKEEKVENTPTSVEKPKEEKEEPKEELKPTEEEKKEE